MNERDTMKDSLLQVSQLNAWYGKSHVLRGVELQIQAGEIVALRFFQIPFR